MAVKVLLVINTEPGRQKKLHTILNDFEEVIYSCLIESGPFDIVGMVEVDTLDGYRILIEKIANLPFTVDFSSFITVDS